MTNIIIAMQKTKFIRSKCLTLMGTVIIWHFRISSVDLEPHRASGKMFEDNNYRQIKSTIMKWWRKNNVTKPIECKYKNAKNYHENEFVKFISRPEIKSFPCSAHDTSTRYYFKGMINERFIEGDLEGKGRLVFISDSQWSNLSHLDSKRKMVMAMKRLNICFKAHDHQGREIKEIIGTFKNGSIHGLTKVTYTDNSFHIGHYKNGKAQGYGRTFDSDNNLRDVGGYYGGWETKYHWRYRFGHILYQNGEMIGNNVSPTIVFAIATDGTLTNPIAGDYSHYSGTLQHIKRVQLIKVLSSESRCMLDIKYKLSNAENYTYSLSTKKKYSLFGHNDFHALCNKTKRFDAGNAPKKLKSWISYITDLLDPRSMQYVIGVSRAPEILWQLSPELEQLNVAKSIRLISDVSLCTETKSMKARVFGSRPVNILFANGHIKLNPQLQVHGFNDIKISADHQQYVPKDETLGWSPTRIAGHFSNGVLNGIALITTNTSTDVWATLKNGILHGPCVIYGISYILDTVSFYL